MSETSNKCPVCGFEGEYKTLCPNCGDIRSFAAPAGSAFLPLLHDMLSMGVPETTATRWHDAVWLLKSHAEHMSEVIEEQIGDREVLREAAANFREAMRTIRPNTPLTDRE